MAEEDTFLVFADISGYTRFIWENRYAQAHAADIVARLLDSVIDALAPRLPLVKLEGDAAFCAGHPGEGAAGQALLRAFEAFRERRDGMAAVNACPCEACRTIPDLDLKMIAHRGPVVRHQARTGEELAGVPVILLHRLAKNGVKERRYLLWTEDAAPLLADLPADAVARRVESDPDLGRVPVHVFSRFTGEAPPSRAAWPRRQLDHLRKAALWWPLMLRGVPGKRASIVHRHGD